MTSTFRLDAARVAYYEANGWRAYYDRRWFRLLRLIVALCQEQFHIPFPMSLLAAYYTIRASVAWVPIHHDVLRVQAYLRKFYGIAHRYAGLPFDVERVSTLEVRYFDVHRRLAGKEDKSEFIKTMADLHSALFDITPEQACESAELRVLAADTVDRITSKTSTDPASDWEKLEEYLCQCYTSIVRERTN